MKKLTRRFEAIPLAHIPKSVVPDVPEQPRKAVPQSTETSVHKIAREPRRKGAE
jgi:hypothetical protein